MRLAIDFIIMIFLFMSASAFIASIGSICICVYYLSMLKINVVNKHYGKSWLKYLKSIFNGFRKK
jgi:hypothetical protein